MKILRYIGRKVIENPGALSGVCGMTIKTGPDYVQIEQPVEERSAATSKISIRRFIAIEINSQNTVLQIRCLRHEYINDSESPRRSFENFEELNDQSIKVLDSIIADEPPVQLYREYEGKRLNKRFEYLAEKEGYSINCLWEANNIEISIDKDGIDKRYLSRKLALDLYITITDKLEIMRIIPSVRESIDYSWKRTNPIETISDEGVRRCLNVLTQKNKKKKKAPILSSWTCSYYISYGRNDFSETADIEIDCTEEEYKLLHILSEAQSGSGSDYYTDKELEKYEDLTVEDIAQLEGFVGRVENCITKSARSELLKISEEGAEKIDTGIYQIHWNYGNVE